eukprot:scaffold155590_cov17-Tisochrysis_lutea.AAC.2
MLLDTSRTGAHGGGACSLYRLKQRQCSWGLTVVHQDKWSVKMCSWQGVRACSPCRLRPRNCSSRPKSAQRVPPQDEKCHLESVIERMAMEHAACPASDSTTLIRTQYLLTRLIYVVTRLSQECMMAERAACATSGSATAYQDSQLLTKMTSFLWCGSHRSAWRQSAQRVPPPIAPPSRPMQPSPLWAARRTRRYACLKQDCIVSMSPS